MAENAASLNRSSNQKDVKARRNTRAPPKRGQIKARIVRELVELVAKAASKAGKAFCMKAQVSAAEQEEVGQLPELRRG